MKVDKYFPTNSLIITWGIPDTEKLIELLHFLPDSSAILWCWNFFPDAFKDFAKQNSRYCQILEIDEHSSFQRTVPNFRGFRTLYFHRTSGLGQLRGLASKYNTFIEKEHQEFWKNNPTLMNLGLRLVSNIIRNMTYIHQRGIKTKQFPILDKPLILVGAGISLQSSLKYLKNLNSSYILAVDTALPILLAEGITPSGVIILDSQYWNTLDFLPLSKIGLKNHEFDIFLDYSSNPGILRLLNEEKIYFFTSTFFQHDFFTSLSNTTLIIPPLGNVSVVGLYLANILKATEISTIAVDFGEPYPGAVLKDGHYHNWIVSHQSRLKPISQVFLRGKELESKNVYSSRISRRDYDLFVQVSQLGRCKVQFENSIRIPWQAQGQNKLNIGFHSPTLKFDVGFHQFIADITFLIQEAEKLIQTDKELWIPRCNDFFQAGGSLFLLPAPGTIPLHRRDLLLPYIYRSLFELRRIVQ